MTARMLRRLFKPAEGRASSLATSGVMLAVKPLLPGLYFVTEAWGGATFRMVDVVRPSPAAALLPGPFAGTPARRHPSAWGMQNIGPARFQDEILRAVEAAHGPCLWACSRGTATDPRGFGTGHAAWAVRVRDGVLVAGVASLADAALVGSHRSDA